MAKEQLKPKKGVVVTEINGVKYFKLQSNYPGDYTKNCGLLGSEIDENFYFLRSNDIDKMSVKDGILTLTRVDGDTLSADVSMPYTFKFDQKTGKLIITDGNGDVQVLEGFVVEGKDVRVATDATLNGDGTKGNPLRLSELEKTGTYAPADELIEVVYDYYARSGKGVNWNYLPHDPITEPYSGTEPEDYVELTEVPTDVKYDSPKFIKVKERIELPTNVKAGYRVVTKESKDNFGLLYNYDEIKKIQEALDATGSLWRVPSRRDWGLMLNAAEYCDADRDHDTKCVNLRTGKNAGARAKSHGMLSDKLPKEEQGLWKWTNKREEGLPVSGEDSLPMTGNNKFTVYPVGYADGSRGTEDKDFDLEAFTRRASFWSITPTNCDGVNCGKSNIFTRTFDYNTRMVIQESTNPDARMSLRLVKDFKPGQMDANEVENILGYDMPVVLITNDETGYSKLWTSINVGFSEYGGVYSNEWSAATGSDRGHEIVYYVNEWDGSEWHKKQMNEGDSIVILDGGLDESGKTIYNHEWRIYSGETGPVLVDTADAIKGEFQEEIDELNNRVDELTEEVDALSATTEEIIENLENEVDRAISAETALQEDIDEEIARAISAETQLQEDIDDLSAFTETAEDNVNDLVNNIIGVEGSVVSGFTMPNFYGAYWEDIDKSEYDAAPDDEKAHIHGSELPDAAQWHEEHPNVNYIELFDDSVEPHVFKYVKLETDAHYISDAENLVDAIEKLDEAISEAIGDIEISKLDTPNPDMLASYVLLVGGEQRGDVIDVPKDDVQAFHEVKVGHSGATIDPVTGEITDGPYLDHEVLLISYLNSEDVYKLVEVDLENIIIENEFASGVTVTDHIVHGVVDPTSEDFFTVGADGFKLSGVQDAIDAERDRAISAETALQEDIDELSAATEDFSAATVAEIARLDDKIDDETARAISAETELQEDIDELSAATIAEIERSKELDRNIAEDIIGVNGISGNTDEGYYIDFAYLEYVETDETPAEYEIMARIPSHEEIVESGDTAPEYINVGGTFYKISPTSNYISNADTIYDAIKALDDKAKETSDSLDNEIARAIARENEIDQKVDDEIARATAKEAELEEAIEDEVERAEAAEEALDAKIDAETERAQSAETALQSDIDEVAADVAELSGAIETIGDELERLDGEDIATDDAYEISATDGLTLKRKNGEEIVISFDGNFGTNMPTPLD